MPIMHKDSILANFFAQGCELMFCLSCLQLQFTAESWLTEIKLEQQQQQPVELPKDRMVPHKAKSASSNWCFLVSLQWASPVLFSVLSKDSSMNTRRVPSEVNIISCLLRNRGFLCFCYYFSSCFLDTDSLFG